MIRLAGLVRGTATGTAGLRTFVINTPGPMGQGGGAEREGSGRGEVLRERGLLCRQNQPTCQQLWEAALCQGLVYLLLHLLHRQHQLCDQGTSSATSIGMFPT